MRYKYLYSTVHIPLFTHPYLFTTCVYMIHIHGRAQCLYSVQKILLVFQNYYITIKNGRNILRREKDIVDLINLFPPGYSVDTIKACAKLTKLDICLIFTFGQERKFVSKDTVRDDSNQNVQIYIFFQYN